MCHHFHLKITPEKLSETLQAAYSQLPAFTKGGFFPLAEIPVLIRNENRGRELVSMQWGLLPYWWKASQKQKSHQAFQRKTFNARSETVAEKPTFRDAFQSRRCLIPVSQFIEGGQHFGTVNKEPMLFAGLWESWRQNDQQITSCTVLTTQANQLVAKYHPRMPVILENPAAAETWLDPKIVSYDSLQPLFLPFPQEKMKMTSSDKQTRFQW